MGRLSLLIGGFFTGCLLISACGSDSGTTPSGAAGSSAGGSGGGASSCVGIYADLTPSAFTAKLTAGLACADSADANLICTKDVTTFTGACGVQCYQANFPDTAAIKTCTAMCVNGKLPSPLSTACSDCYTTDVVCTATSCANQGCLTDPAGSSCVNCRVQAGCAPDFYTCSGLPIPGAAGGAAGASN